NEQSRPRSRPGLSSAPAWLCTRHPRGIGGSLAGNNPIHALAVRLLRLQPEPELLAHHGGQEGAHRVRLPAGGARDGGDGGAARSAQQCQHPRLLRIRSPLGLTAAGRLRADLGCRPRLDGARRFALGHAKLLSRASAQQRAGGLAQQRAGGLAQQRAATTQTPRRPIGAGGVRGASRSGSASVITTHALFARKVQRKLSNGVAGFAAGGSSSDRKRARPIVPSRRRRMMANARAERLLKIPAEPSPELRIPGAAAQTRVVSMAGIRLDSRKSVRAFKGIICDDISEFESSHASQTVRSLCALSGLPNYVPERSAPGLMRESDMDFVHAVLKTLQVVAGHLLDIPNLDEARRGPVWKMRERWRLAVAEIGENEIEIFARRIGLQGH